MRVIINADDFGYHTNANRAIAECFAKGVVTNATAMVTMPDFGQGLALAQSQGFADRIGLHINLSVGIPLTDGIKRSRLFCDEDGVFNNAIRQNRFYRFWLPSNLKSLIADEIRAQMRLFIKYGLTQRHYDSHGQVGANFAYCSGVCERVWVSEYADVYQHECKSAQCKIVFAAKDVHPSY